MTQIRYQKVDPVRQRAQGVSKELYSNSDINEIIERWSILCHQALGKSTSTKFTSSDSEYEVVKGVALFGSAWEILGGMDDMNEEARTAKRQLDMYLDMLKEMGGGGIVVIKKGFGLTDRLDASQYSIVDQV